MLEYTWKKIDFRAEIENYRDSLNPLQRNSFYEVVGAYEKKQLTIKHVYYALSHLGNRDITKYTRLMVNSDFLDEIQLDVDSYDASRDMAVEKLFKQDELDIRYARLMIPALAREPYEYQPSPRCKALIREIFGEEELPDWIVQKFNT